MVPESMVRHLMPLGNKGSLIQLDLLKAVSDLSQPFDPLDSESAVMAES